MPGASAVASGNELLDTMLYVTITPPATITTAVLTQQNVTINGLALGDCISWNMLTFTSTLISVTNMYVSAANTLTITWSTEGATVSNAAAQNFILELVRPNIVPYTALPNALE
jgi:hypothetical protein